MEPQNTGTNKMIIAVVVIAVAVIGIYALINSSKGNVAMEKQKDATTKEGGVMMKKEEGSTMNESMTMKLASLGNSGMTGDVLFVPKGEFTEVSIMLNGAVKGSIYPAHIHEGSCPTPGSVKYPLTSFVDGKSITLVKASVDQLWKTLPLAISVHKSPTELKSYVACGDLKTATGNNVGGSMVKAGGTMMQKEEGVMMTKAGSYEAYSPEKIAQAAAKGDVVLFFRALWCPTCRALDADINANLKNIPANLTILYVDYDNSTDLKKKYGVTYQHTLVQVDKNGTLIKKWTKSPTLTAFIADMKK